MAVTPIRKEPEPAVAGIGDEFEGVPVVGVGYEVRGIEGGLREPAQFNPVAFGAGEEGYLVLHFVHRSPRFDPADKKDLTGDRIRVQILDVLEGTIVDEAVVLDAIRRQREINAEGRRREEAAKGVGRLGLGEADDEDFALAQAHAAGEHSKPAAGCPICAAETAKTEPDEDDAAAVMVRQHLRGTHADGLREGCVMCRTESAAQADGD